MEIAPTFWTLHFTFWTLCWHFGHCALHFGHCAYILDIALTFWTLCNTFRTLCATFWTLHITFWTLCLLWSRSRWMNSVSGDIPDLTSFKEMVHLGSPSKIVCFETIETGTETSFGTIRSKTFVSVVSHVYQNSEFRCLVYTETNWNKPKTIEKDWVSVLLGSSWIFFVSRTSYCRQ